MIKFLNEELRLRFHQLPIEEQEKQVNKAEELLLDGLVMTITYIDTPADGVGSDIEVRIDKEFEPSII